MIALPLSKQQLHSGDAGLRLRRTVHLLLFNFPRRRTKRQQCGPQAFWHPTMDSASQVIRLVTALPHHPPLQDCLPNLRSLLASSVGSLPRLLLTKVSSRCARSRYLPLFCRPPI